MLCENVVTLIVITIFSELLRFQFLIDQTKKMLNPQHFHINLKFKNFKVLKKKKSILGGHVTTLSNM